MVEDYAVYFADVAGVDAAIAIDVKGGVVVAAQDCGVLFADVSGVDTVTVRDRDSMEQARVKVSELTSYIQNAIRNYKPVQR